MTVVNNLRMSEGHSVGEQQIYAGIPAQCDTVSSSYFSGQNALRVRLYAYTASCICKNKPSVLAVGNVQVSGQSEREGNSYDL